MDGREQINAIEYIGAKVITIFGLRVLLQSTWDVAQKVKREQFIQVIRAEIDKIGASTSYSKGQRVALQRLLELVLSKE